MIRFNPPQRKAHVLNIGDSIVHDDEVVTIEGAWPAGLISAGNGVYVPAIRIDWYNPESKCTNGKYSRIGMTIVPSDKLMTLAHQVSGSPAPHTD